MPSLDGSINSYNRSEIPARRKPPAGNLPIY
jgi:hypothetical protein